VINKDNLHLLTEQSISDVAEGKNEHHGEAIKLPNLNIIVWQRVGLN
jgi:hypothetical protein